MLFNIFIPFLLLAHDYHVSIYNLDFKENECQISMKLFSDDMKKALELSGNKMQIGDFPDEGQESELMQKYIKDNFNVFLNKVEMELIFEGAEWDEDFHTIIFYWLIPLKNNSLENLEISNSIFTEVSEEQQNMHYIVRNENKTSVLLDKSITKTSVQLN